MKGLGFKSYVCHFVLFNCSIFLYDMLEHDKRIEISRFIHIIMKHRLVALVVHMATHVIANFPWFVWYISGVVVFELDFYCTYTIGMTRLVCN